MTKNIGEITKGDITMTGTNKRIFYPGKYYVVTADNKVILAANSMTEARQQGLAETDTILIAVTAVSPDKPKAIPLVINKIVFNFDKKLLTVDGDSVTLNGVIYNKGENEIDEEELKDWSLMLTDANKICKAVEIVGTPPIDGKDITNEMSDL